jgi:hypothetical protein
MFIVDVTTEDTRLMAKSEVGDLYSCTILDHLTGETAYFDINAGTLGTVVSMMIADEEEQTPKNTVYEFLEELELPVNLRPIP